MKIKINMKSIVILVAVCIISLFFINISLAANTGKIIVETANLRETASESSKILEQLSMDQEVEILEKVENWYKIKANGITGYLREDLIKVSDQVEQNSTQNNNIISENTIETQETQTNQTEQNQAPENQAPENQVQENQVQENSNLQYIKEDTKLKIVPVINATDIIEVKKDEEVTVTETINGWVCVETKTAKGWIRQEKLQTKQEKQAQEQATTQTNPETQTQQPAPETQTPETQAPETPAPTSTPSVTSQAVNKTLYIKSASVNVRRESSTSAEILTTVSVNTAVTVTEELSNGWSKVSVNGIQGYILSSLLSTQKQETSRSQTQPRQEASQAQTAQTSTNAATKTQTAPETTATQPTPSGKGATVVETAKKYLGCKYVYGGTTPSGFDCSGFTSYVFKLHGITLSRTSQAQSKNGVAVAKNNLQPGDLVFFYSGISHVGIYIGGGSFIHASTSKTGVIISTLTSGYYNNNYACARRVL